MSLTPRENSLIRKIPEQWRSLLTLLLSNKSAKCNQLVSVLAMRYRCQGTQSAESWDILLMAMRKRVPFVDNNNTLCFQSLLWCFSYSFIQVFLTFLLRFHDVISADSLDRFLSIPLPESDSVSVHHLLQQLSAVLAKRNGMACDNQAVVKDERNGLFYWKTSTGEGKESGFTGGDIMKKQSRNCLGDHIDTDANAPRKSVESEQMLPGTRDDPDRIQSKMITSPLPDKEFCGTDKATVSTKSSEKLTPCLDILSSATILIKDTNVKKPTKAKNSTTEMAESSESFVIILDSSDEEDGIGNETNTEVVGEKEGQEVCERGGLDICEIEREVCVRGVETVYRRVELQPYYKQEVQKDVGCEESQANSIVVTMSEASKHAETSHGDAGDDVSGDDDGNGNKILNSVQKLKEALSSGERVAASEDFDFLLSISASQVSKAFAVVWCGSLEEDAVCGLIQGVVPLSERLSQAVGAAVVDSIVRPLCDGMEETPSRQLMSSLSDLAAAFPQHLASVLCDCLTDSLCNSVQSEMAATLCKSWPTDTLLCFLRKLCKSDLQLDENLLSVVQNIIGKQPDLNSGLLDPVLCLLETGAVPMARNAKYGRLVLNFVKGYKSQMNSSHLPALQSIVSTHASVIRKSLQSAVNSLAS